jgi:Integrase core domain
VVPQPQKRPRSSLIRFCAELPNEMWQADLTHWSLAGGQGVEILNVIDDHSRLFLASRAYRSAKAADVAEAFRSAVALHGAPASLLCDNGAVFTARPRGGKVLLQLEMERLGVLAKNSRPYHPQTCGKVERLHQTTPPGPGRSHAPSGLQRPGQGAAGPGGRPRDPFPRPPRQGRRPRQGQPALRLKAPSHRHRPRPQGLTDQAADRRSRHPRPRRAHGGGASATHPRSEPRLPADPRGLRCLR